MSSLRHLTMIAAITIVAAAVFVGTLWSRKEKEPDQSQSPPALPEHSLPDSPFLNTHSGEYVGSAACLACHQASAEGYRRSGMGRSAARVQTDDAPPDGELVHQKSGRRYTVYRESGQLRHREVLLTDEDSSENEIVLEDQPMLYQIGSGAHAQTYLTEIEGFLVESPVTWFSAHEHWGMSPGYDVPEQQGFERAVGQTCLRCHVGQSHAVDGSFHKMEVLEEAIGCERCHGPGSLHVAHHSGDTPSALSEAEPAQEGIDLTIVNPAHLDRKLSDDICASCHHQPAVALSAPSRSMDDFRPGLPLDAFRIDYRPDLPEDQMTVVGHVAQLRQSLCYQQSEMSCAKCHDPHNLPDEPVKAAFYRSKCFECHASDACSVDSGFHIEIARDACIDCHMPSSATEVPHVAFTHHRIGIHDPDSLGKHEDVLQTLNATIDLVAESDVSWLSPAQRSGWKGAAFDEFSQVHVAFASVYEQRAYELMRQAWEAGVADAEVAGRLAFLGGQFQDPRTPRYVNDVLSQDDATGQQRSNALLTKTNWLAQQGRFDEAREAALKLTTLRRNWIDWILLARIEENRGDMPTVVQALEKVLTINPMHEETRRALVNYYDRQGDTVRTQFHRERLSNRTP